MTDIAKLIAEDIAEREKETLDNIIDKESKKKFLEVLKKLSQEELLILIYKNNALRLTSEDIAKFLNIKANTLRQKKKDIIDGLIKEIEKK